MNRRIAKWIQIGLFAALPVGFTAVAAAQDTPPSDATHAPGTMAPSDTNSLDQKKDNMIDDTHSKAKSNDDIERTRGGADDTSGTSKETTTTTKKKKTHKSSTDTKMMNDDSSKMNDSKMKPKSTDDDINAPPSDSKMQNPDPTK